MEILFESVKFKNYFDKSIDILIEAPIGSQPINYQVDPNEEKNLVVRKTNLSSVSIIAKWATDPDHNGRLLLDLQKSGNYPSSYLTELTAHFKEIGRLNGEVKVQYGVFH